MSESIQKRAAILPVRWVDEHSGGFVDDDEVVVFEDDVEIDLLGSHRGSAGTVDGDLDEILRFQLVAFVLVAAVHLACSCFHEVAEIHFAEAVEMVQKKIL